MWPCPDFEHLQYSMFCKPLQQFTRSIDSIGIQEEISLVKARDKFFNDSMNGNSFMPSARMLRSHTWSTLCLYLCVWHQYHCSLGWSKLLFWFHTLALCIIYEYFYGGKTYCSWEHFLSVPKVSLTLEQYVERLKLVEQNVYLSHSKYYIHT